MKKLNKLTHRNLMPLSLPTNMDASVDMPTSPVTEITDVERNTVGKIWFMDSSKKWESIPSRLKNNL